MSPSVWAVYALLALSTAAVWVPRLRVCRVMIAPWAPAYALAIGAALAIGVLRPVGALALGIVLGLAVFVSRRTRTPRALNGATPLVLGLLMLPFALHVVPGFNNPKLLDAVRVSAAGPPFTQFLNFDKGSAGLILLAFLAPLASTSQQWRAASRTALVLGVPTVVLTAAVGLLIGHFALDLKVPPQVAGLLLAQLFFICAAEEAFFRGFVQERLHRAFASSPAVLAALAPMAIATALFAAVHAAGGWQLVLLATLSGTGAALAYARTRTVEAPILIHFGVNATHLFTLTYPYQL